MLAVGIPFVSLVGQLVWYYCPGRVEGLLLCRPSSYQVDCES